MDAKTLKKLADQLDEISANFSALSATFRSGSGSAAGGSVNGKAAKSVPAGKSKPAADPDETEGEEIDVDTLREKLKELAETKGKEAMVAALAEVGAGALKDVDESQYKECFDKAQELLDAEDEEVVEPVKSAKKTAATKKPAAKKVTLKQLTEAATALIEADKPAYLKLAKKFGKPSEADADVYADFLEAITGAMPEGEVEEDLL